MAISPFNPIPNVTTHADATALFNANFADAENRLNSIESDVSQISGEFNIVKLRQTSASSVSGVLDIDSTEAYVHTVTLNEEVANFSIQNSEAGDGGSLIFRQDNSGGWGVDFGAYQIIGGYADLLTGITPSGIGACFVNWYDDGTDLTIIVGAPY